MRSRSGRPQRRWHRERSRTFEDELVPTLLAPVRQRCHLVVHSIPLIPILSLHRLPPNQPQTGLHSVNHTAFPELVQIPLNRTRTGQHRSLLAPEEVAHLHSISLHQLADQDQQRVILLPA
ncbi:hypothetical protein BDV28DRAFT_129084 [Aspergillus coremiiformis]|uniref:Uncharacterized protein n=1 Tax=Aspergillus coremiiformis TaxID=138285 RepID=A0A5N6ZET6_9EURO|nr:hypothetical protein BDV28DRAFT_129084 [Aspergillus coremiiformis]